LNPARNILLIFFLLPLTALKAQYSNIEFVENKGQWDSKIKFAGKVNAGAFYVQQKGFQVLQHSVEDWKKITDVIHDHHGGKLDLSTPLTLRSHAYQVQFVNGNENPEIIPDKSLPGYNNYFIGNDPSKWASECKIYQGITMKNIYPNVDVRYYSNNGGMKYDIIVHPGGDISRIAMKYTGADKLELKNKELIIGTSVGNLKELNPYTYQDKDKGRKEISAKFLLKNNLVSFDVKDYDQSTTLIIDPTLIFCSFTGSTADNWGFTATYGPDGSMFGGGIVFFGNGFPVSTGAIQTTFQGGFNDGFNYGPLDMGIIKLTPDGSTRVYATYIGGNGNDIPQSLIVDGQGNLVIAGRSNSPTTGTGAYPTTGTGSFGPGGNFDIVVTKLNATGTALIGSKKIGGTGDDGANITIYSNSGTISLQHNYGDECRGEVILDNAGNIYVAGCTQSTNFPTVAAFQSSNAGGNNGQDGVVLKLSPDVSSLLFSSYLGGNGNDAAYVLDISPTTGNLYVAGGTESSTATFPGTHAGTIGPNYNGAIDGFVAEISGTSLVRSTFIGTSGYDQVYGLKFDRFGFPYIMGQTTGTWQVINAPYFNAGAKQFISKLQPDLSANVYSTTFGSPGATLPNISPVAFLVDRCQNVYVSGWGGCFACGTNPATSGFPNTGTSNAMPVTPDAIKSTTDTHDFYFFVLKRDAATILYGSFFGENNLPNLNGCDHVDGGTSRFDQNGVIYQAICANCQLGDNAVFPTTPGAWATTNPSPNCNLAMLKMNFNLAGVGANVVSEINGIVNDSAGCVPLTVQFIDSVANAVSYEWNFGDGSPQLVTTTPNATHTYNLVGNYLVRLVAVDSATCNIRDTSYINIKVGALQALPDFNAVKLLPCDSFKYRFDNMTIPIPIAPFKNNSFIWDFGDGSPRTTTGATPVFHNYPAAGTYNVKLILNDTTYCNSPDSITKQISIAASVKAKFTTPPSGCVPYTAVLNNTSTAGQTFQWDFGDGGTSSSINPTHVYSTPGTYTIILVANDPSTCNLSDTFRFTITVYSIPTANFSFTPVPPVANTPATFTNLSSPDAIRFLWQFGDGDSLITASRANILHQYRATGTFNACLIATNAGGCPDTICKQVATLVIPAVDVPSAFTPLSGDINSTVLVRGYGIVKMKFMIWNRWGQKVFESSDINSGWDGRFKGAVQPMDVYAYTLDVEFFDGTKATKKGDITLIR
jgi:gliding motility-associated-like protein